MYVKSRFKVHKFFYVITRCKFFNLTLFMFGYSALKIIRDTRIYSFRSVSHNVNEVFSHMVFFYKPFLCF